MLMISIPVRYMHSPVEMIDLRDMEGLFQLLLKIVMADKKDLRKIAGVKSRKA